MLSYRVVPSCTQIRPKSLRLRTSISVSRETCCVAVRAEKAGSRCTARTRGEGGSVRSREGYSNTCSDKGNGGKRERARKRGVTIAKQK